MNVKCLEIYQHGENLIFEENVQSDVCILIFLSNVQLIINLQINSIIFQGIQKRGIFLEIRSFQHLNSFTYYSQVYQFMQLKTKESELCVMRTLGIIRKHLVQGVQNGIEIKVRNKNFLLIYSATEFDNFSYQPLCRGCVSSN